MEERERGWGERRKRFPWCEVPDTYSITSGNMLNDVRVRRKEYRKTLKRTRARFSNECLNLRSRRTWAS